MSIEKTTFTVYRCRGQNFNRLEDALKHDKIEAIVEALMANSGKIDMISEQNIRAGVHFFMNNEGLITTILEEFEKTEQIMRRNDGLFESGR